MISATFGRRKPVPAAFPPNHTLLRRFGNISAAAILALAVSGCAIGKSADELAADSGLTTGSIQRDVQIEGVDPGDIEAIKFAITRAPGGADGSNLISWTNPETERGGIISEISEASAKDARMCRYFRTTFEGYAGISLYNGEICTTGNGSAGNDYWVLTSLKRDSSD